MLRALPWQKTDDCAVLAQQFCRTECLLQVWTILFQRVHSALIASFFLAKHQLSFLSSFFSIVLPIFGFSPWNIFQIVFLRMTQAFR